MSGITTFQQIRKVTVEFAKNFYPRGNGEFSVKYNEDPVPIVRGAYKGYIWSEGYIQINGIIYDLDYMLENGMKIKE